jgi:hypothetical protein
VELYFRISIQLYGIKVATAQGIAVKAGVGSLVVVANQSAGCRLLSVHLQSQASVIAYRYWVGVAL